MEEAIALILKFITEGGKDGVLLLGWLLFLVERYHFSPKREKEFREDLTASRKDYLILADKVAATLSGFSVILEVVKDRIGRAK